jgi:hypothetical protein
MFHSKAIRKTGSEKLDYSFRTFAFALIAGATAGVAIGKFGLLAGIGLVGLPLGLLFVGWMFSTPQVGIVSAVIIAFFATGIARYADGPWGLMLDFALFIAWISLLFQKFRDTDWTPLSNGTMKVTFVWFLFIVLELGNPESNGLECWFYAMRTAGFYQLLTFGLVFMWWREARYFDMMLKIMAWFSILGALWGLKQQNGIIDAAEYKWLYVDGNAMTHVLFGVLRVFSFYSDAGQFGASQAMVAMSCGMIASNSHVKSSDRIFYGVAALLTFIGFAISGTRGAVAVFAGGGVLYLILSKNFKIMALGGGLMLTVFVFLKYTKAFQNVEQVRRMRTSLNSDDPSLLVRLENQKKFAVYLKSRPIGGGVGSAGFWGQRFGPYKVPAQIPTDSYYVRVWAETGLIGICLHLFMFGYFMGRGGAIIWHLRDPVIKIKATAIYCGMAGVFLANYGNQVFSQQPTSILMGLGIPLVMLSPLFDEEVTNKRAKT